MDKIISICLSLSYLSITLELNDTVVDRGAPSDLNKFIQRGKECFTLLRTDGFPLSNGFPCVLGDSTLGDYFM